MLKTNIKWVRVIIVLVVAAPIILTVYSWAVNFLGDSEVYVRGFLLNNLVCNPMAWILDSGNRTQYYAYYTEECSVALIFSILRALFWSFIILIFILFLKWLFLLFKK